MGGLEVKRCGEPSGVTSRKVVAIEVVSAVCVMVGSEGYDASDGEMQSAEGAGAGICDRWPQERTSESNETQGVKPSIHRMRVEGQQMKHEMLQARSRTLRAVTVR